MSSDYFEKFASEKKGKPQGIPGITMNAPVVPCAVVGDIGIEIEVEGIGLPTGGYLEAVKAATSASRWVNKADHSLRGESQEYVLNVPCLYEEVEGMVKGLYGVFETHASKLRPSNRCSTHVHINIGGLKINQLTSIIALWTVFEEALINWCGEERKTNHFCLSSKDSAACVSNWHRLLTRGEGRRSWGDGLKYSALNLHTIYQYGSLEFRTAPLFKDATKVIQWAKFLHEMKQYAIEKFDNPTTLAYELSERTGEQIFRDICEKADIEDFFKEVRETVDDFQRMSLEGFRRVQPCVLGVPWDQWMPVIGAAYVPDPFAKAKKGKSQTIEWENIVPDAPRRGGGILTGRPLRVRAREDVAPPVPDNAAELQARELLRQMERDQVLRPAAIRLDPWPAEPRVDPFLPVRDNEF